MRLKLLFLFLFAVTLSASETITIINTTDLHGNFSNSYGGKCAVIPQLASEISSVVQKSGRKNTLLIDCGDVLLGSALAAHDQGEMALETLNKLGYDVWIPGNHDFEFGAKVLSRRIHEFKGDFLCANLRIRGEQFAPWKIYTRNGRRIAVIGLTNHHTPTWYFHPERQGIFFTHTAEALKRVIPEVMAEKPDLIVLAIHTGRFIGKRFNDPFNLYKLLKPYPQIALVLGGHSHEIVPGETLGKNSPVWFAQAGAKAAGFIRVDVTFNGNQRPKITSAFIKVNPKRSYKRSEALSRFEKQQNRIITRRPPQMQGKNKKAAEAELFHQAIRKAFPDADIVFHGLLSKYKLFPENPVRERDLFGLCPFENMAVTAWITPEQCRAIIREQETESARSGMYQYVSGVRINPDGTLILADGTHWTAGRRKAIFNSYAAASGGMRFPVLQNILNDPAAKAVSTEKRIRDLLKDYLKGNQK